MTYNIIRFYIDPDKDSEVVLKGLSEHEAREWCKRDDTHGLGWFDGYEVEND